MGGPLANRAFLKRVVPQKNTWGGLFLFFDEIIASSLYLILLWSHWITSVRFFNQTDTATPPLLPLLPPRLWKPKGTFNLSREALPQHRRHGLLQWGAMVLLLWLPLGSSSRAPTSSCSPTWGEQLWRRHLHNFAGHSRYVKRKMSSPNWFWTMKLYWPGKGRVSTQLLTQTSTSS